MLKTLDPAELSIPDLHSVLLSTIVPRPIALASTVNPEGEVNLSPFSFFNVFSANPPVVIFSPARRVRDNSTKDTLDNVLETKEGGCHWVAGLFRRSSITFGERVDCSGMRAFDLGEEFADVFRVQANIYNLGFFAGFAGSSEFGFPGCIFKGLTSFK